MNWPRFILDGCNSQIIARVRNLDGERQNQFGFHGSASNAALQREAIQKLHGDEGFTMPVVNLVDSADVWMIRCRGCFGFEGEDNVEFAGKLRFRPMK